MLNKLNLKNKIGLVILVILAAYSFSNYKEISSAPTDNAKGYAWGADKDGSNPTGGLGWVSFNCINEPGSCGIGNNYGVNINPTTLDVTGYAWSNNYGWLKFGGLSGFPTATGTVASNAKFVGTYTGGNFNGYIQGWARFCSPAANPETCSGFVENDKNGGWDGWVSLKSTTAPLYGVNVASNIISGYAWGGNNNGKNPVGWISFGGTAPTYNVNIATNNTVLDFYASPSPSASPFTTTLYWNSLNGTPFTSCTADSAPTLNTANVPEWNTATSLTPNVLSGSRSVTVPYDTTNYKITCLQGSNSYTSTISVPRLINEKITLSNTKVTGGLTTLSWTGTNVTGCVASTLNPAGITLWTGAKASTGTQTSVPVTAVLPAKTTYSLTCNGTTPPYLPVTVSLDLHTTSGAATGTKIPVYKEN
jgi:hypothetical protein